MTPLQIPIPAELVEPLNAAMRGGFALIGRVGRVWDNSPPDSGPLGSLFLELGAVPESALPALREAIRTASSPTTSKPSKPKKSNTKL